MITTIFDQNYLLEAIQKWNMPAPSEVPMTFAHVDNMVILERTKFHRKKWISHMHG